LILSLTSPKEGIERRLVIICSIVIPAKAGMTILSEIYIV